MILLTQIPLWHSQLRCVIVTWWRHQMQTFSALLAICAGNSPVPGDFPAQRPVTRSFDVFFDLRLNKRLSKQSWGRWFDRLSHPLWRHCNEQTPNRSCLRASYVVSIVRSESITIRYSLQYSMQWQLILDRVIKISNCTMLNATQRCPGAPYYHDGLISTIHHDVMSWKACPHCWHFVKESILSNGQWYGTFVFIVVSLNKLLN